jgi:hypothetical protein
MKSAAWLNLASFGREPCVNVSTPSAAMSTVNLSFVRSTTSLFGTSRALKSNRAYAPSRAASALPPF